MNNLVMSLLPNAQAAYATISEAIDPLDTITAQRIADVLKDFKREVHKHDGAWTAVQGAVEFPLHSQIFALIIVPDQVDSITVQATLKPHDATNVVTNPPLPRTAFSATSKPMRCISDNDFEKDLVSQKTRKLDEHDDTMNKRTCPADNEHIMMLITKEDLDDLLVKLREDIQEDTAECVNHVQRLLRRAKEEWRQQSKWDRRQRRMPSLNLRVGTGATLGVSFPSLRTKSDEQVTSISDIIQRETKLLSTQIKWAEDCRRVAADIHDTREEIWRTSSAAFHHRQQQDRENFQSRMLDESGVHT